MSTLRVIGVPKNIKLLKFVTLMKKTLYDTNQVFYVHPRLVMGNHLAPGTKEMVVDFPNVESGRVAQERMDNSSYTYNNEIYVLKAVVFKNPNNYYATPNYNKHNKVVNKQFEHRNMHNNAPVMYDGYGHSQFGRNDEYGGNYYREKPHNPAYNNTAKIDREIELLRKQRLIIEEERKLLLEQKKLDELKMNNIRNVYFKNKDIRNDNAQSSFPLKRKADTDSARAPNKKKYKQPPPQSQNQLPSFYKPCGSLIIKMGPLLNKLVPCLERRKLVLKLLRFQLRMRIALLVDGKRLYQTNKILSRYRKKHPESSDEAFIIEVMNTINETQWPGGEIKLNKKGLPKKINPNVYLKAGTADKNPSTSVTKNEDGKDSKHNDELIEIRDDGSDAPDKGNKHNEGFIEIEENDDDIPDVEVIIPKDANVEDKTENNEEQKKSVKSQELKNNSNDITGSDSVIPISSDADVKTIEPNPEGSVKAYMKGNTNEAEKNGQTNEVEISSNADRERNVKQQDENDEEKVKENTKKLEIDDQTKELAVSRNVGNETNESKQDVKVEDKEKENTKETKIVEKMNEVDNSNTEESHNAYVNDIITSVAAIIDDSDEWPQGCEDLID